MLNMSHAEYESCITNDNILLTFNTFKENKLENVEIFIISERNKKKMRFILLYVAVLLSGFSRETNGGMGKVLNL